MAIAALVWSFGIRTSEKTEANGRHHRNELSVSVAGCILSDQIGKTVVRN